MRNKKAMACRLFRISFYGVMSLSLLYSAHSQAKSSTDITRIIQKVAALATTPHNVSRIHEDWTELNRHFPKTLWKEVRVKDFPFSKRAKISKDVTVTINGARSFILSSELALFSADGSVDFWDVLKRSTKILDVRCDSSEKLTYAERYLRLELTGLKAVNAKYESSAGSAGVAVTISFDEKIRLPKPGAPAIEGKWADKCS